MKFICPSCGIHLQAESDLAGKTVKCPGCATRIQIPETKSALPPPDGTDPQQESSAEEMVGDYYEQLPELESYTGKSLPHPSWVNPLLALAIGAGATFVQFIVVYPMSKDNYLRGLFLERGWSQHVTVFLFFWCAGLLFQKWLNLRKQRRAMLIEALPSDMAEEITVRNLPEFHSHVMHFPKPLRNTYIVNRIRKALEYFYVRQSNPETTSMVTSLSDIDYAKANGSYSIVKLFLWAIPIMGFIGTVVGIGNAIMGFGAVLGQSGGGGGGGVDALMEPLMGVLKSLGVAFDTTLLALVYSIILAFPANSLQGDEEDLVAEVDQYCNDNLLKRLNDGGAGASNLDSNSGLLKALGDAIADGQHDMLLKFEAMAKSLEPQMKNAEKMAGLIEKQLAAVGDRAQLFEKRLDKELISSADRVQSTVVEGLRNLNDVLKELNGKQVVVQKRGWFSRG